MSLLRLRISLLIGRMSAASGASAQDANSEPSSTSTTTSTSTSDDWSEVVKRFRSVTNSQSTASARRRSSADAERKGNCARGRDLRPC